MILLASCSSLHVTFILLGHVKHETKTSRVGEVSKVNFRSILHSKEKHVQVAVAFQTFMCMYVSKDAVVLKGECTFDFEADLQTCRQC